MTVLQTERLILREATVDDAEFMLKLLNEPAWHQFIYSHSIDTKEKAAEYIEQKMQLMYRDHGVGLWVMEKKVDKNAIGICGLLKRDVLPHMDLGFALLSDYWGRGYAYEASIGCLEYASNHLKTTKVLAIADPSNSPSIRLLKKAGFTFESDFSYPGSDKELALLVLLLSKVSNN